MDHLKKSNTTYISPVIYKELLQINDKNTRMSDNVHGRSSIAIVVDFEPFFPTTEALSIERWQTSMMRKSSIIDV